MPPPAIDPNRHDGHLVPRGLSGPNQGIVIGTLVGSFVFFGLLIWLYHCVNEDKGGYGTTLYDRPPSPPRRLRNLGPQTGGVPPQGRSLSMSPPRAPRSTVGMPAPVNSPLRPVRRAASHAPAPSRARSPQRPRIPSPRPLPPAAQRIPQIRRTSPSPRQRVAPSGRDLRHDIDRRETRDLHQDLERAIPPRDLGPSALQLERERDLARRMAEQNERERSRRPSSSSSRTRQPRIVLAEPGNPARRPPPSSSSSSVASSGPMIVMAAPESPARRRAAPSPSSSSSSSSGPVIVMAESENPTCRGPRPPPPSSFSNSTLVQSASQNGRRGGNTRSQPPNATTAVTLPEPGSRHSARSPRPLPFSQHGNPRPSFPRHVPAAGESGHPSRRPPSSVSSPQGPRRAGERDPRDLGRRAPRRSASSAGRGSDGARSNVSYERVRRMPGAWRD